jgi:hypothetical protein
MTKPASRTEFLTVPLTPYWEGETPIPERSKALRKTIKLPETLKSLVAQRLTSTRRIEKCLS